MKPFDPEAAKRGEKVMYANGEEVAEWHVWKDGTIVSKDRADVYYRHKANGSSTYDQFRSLVMAPPPMKEVTYWINAYTNHEGELYSCIYATEKAAKARADVPGAVAIAQPITIKVPV